MLRRGMMIVLLLGIVAIEVSFVIPLVAQEAVEVGQESKLSDRDRELNLQSFDIVWETIRDRHYDPELNGVDWDAARTELRPKINEAESQDEAREVMDELIRLLNQSHFVIIPKSGYEALEKDDTTQSGPGVIGVTVRVIQDQALVVDVTEGFPASMAGVRPGWIVSEIEGKDVGTILEKVKEAFGDSTMLRLYLARSIESRLSGPVGKKRTVHFLNQDDESVETELELIQPKGRVASFGNLPDIQIEFESKTLEGSIGYIRWTSFFDPVGLMPEIRAAVRTFQDAPGLVIDLRGNTGGIGAMAMGISGFFFDKTGTKLGTMTTRDSSLNFITYRQSPNYSGPLALLVDGSSASTSEIFAGGMQDNERARIFGSITAGAALPSQVTKLPNGDRFQFAFANFVSANGVQLEGTGVVPDEIIPIERATLLESKDPVLEAAIEWLKTQDSSDPK